MSILVSLGNIKYTIFFLEYIYIFTDVKYRQRCTFFVHFKNKTILITHWDTLGHNDRVFDMHGTLIHLKSN
jgi:hypothetical protein